MRAWTSRRRSPRLDARARPRRCGSTTPPPARAAHDRRPRAPRGSTSAASRRTTRRTSATPRPTSPSTCSTAPGATPATRCTTSRTSPTSTTRCSSARPRPASTGSELAERETELFREDMTALRVLPPDALRRRRRGDPAGRRAGRSGCASAAPRTRSTATSTSRCAPTRASARCRDLDERADARAVRRARRRPGPARQEGPARLPALAGRASGRAGLGHRRWAAAGPAGTSSARRSRCSHLGEALRRAGRRQRPRLPAPRDGRVARPRRRSTGGRSRGPTCTPAWSATTARRCRSPRATSSSSRGCARPGVDPMAIRLALLAHHYRADWEWTDDDLDRGRGPPRPLARGGPTAPSRAQAERLVAARPRRAGRRPRRARGASRSSTRGPSRPAPRRRLAAPTLVRDLLDARLGRRSWTASRSRVASSSVSRREVALELAGDRLAAGLGEVGGVAGLLERADVVADLLVLLGQLVDAALPGPGLLGQVAERDADLEQVLELAEQRQRGLGARRLGDVVRDRGPERHRRHVGLRARRPGRPRRCRSGLRSATARA